ncbi:MAG: nucleotidyltransferase domain-containing protein [Bacteroidaceae bacterium]|nr:nucleotidyltransferase domain-containing protein [Bacteroidaceae bacterium]MBQ8675588.1 nucleotidyltransferase domain-containing protein [Bacteroidaceae bacterium]MBQ9175754.1 nucleotidyltransferase domain-containing protein [Bacteroidaceae bacterium]
MSSLGLHLPDSDIDIVILLRRYKKTSAQI